MAHQNIKDIPTELSASIFGNCGTLVGMLMSADDAARFKKEAQLKNFDDTDDKHGTRAQIQLQNFDPGMCAITTPKNKKAFIVRVPEHPVFDWHEQIAEIEQLSKQNYGVTLEPQQPKPKKKSSSPDADTTTPPPSETDNDFPQEDEFGYRIS